MPQLNPNTFVFVWEQSTVHVTAHNEQRLQKGRNVCFLYIYSAVDKQKYFIYDCMSLNKDHFHLGGVNYSLNAHSYSSSSYSSLDQWES